MDYLKQKISDIRIKIRSALMKKYLKNSNFTIISNNCWGGEVYRELDIPYATPLVGLFILGPCYMRLLKDLRRYMESRLVFAKTSRYEKVNMLHKYPIGILGGDVEIHFLHYTSFAEVEEKWSRRLSRVNWNNIFVKFDDWMEDSPELIEEFEALDFSNKICFTRSNYAQCKSTVWIKERKETPSYFDALKWYYLSRKYFDVVDWLNGGTGRPGFLLRVLNTLLYQF